MRGGAVLELYLHCLHYHSDCSVENDLKCEHVQMSGDQFIGYYMSKTRMVMVSAVAVGMRMERNAKKVSAMFGREIQERVMISTGNQRVSLMERDIQISDLGKQFNFDAIYSIFTNYSSEMHPLGME